MPARAPMARAKPEMLRSADRWGGRCGVPKTRLKNQRRSRFPPAASLPQVRLDKGLENRMGLSNYATVCGGGRNASTPRKSLRALKASRPLPSDIAAGGRGARALNSCSPRKAYDATRGGVLERNAEVTGDSKKDDWKPSATMIAMGKNAALDRSAHARATEGGRLRNPRIAKCKVCEANSLLIRFVL